MGKLTQLLRAVRRHLGWAIRDRFPGRRVVREVQGVRLALPWAHRLPDYAAAGLGYGQNLVELARALADRSPDRFTMLDVGANVGDSTLQVLNAADGAVLCVEADPFYLDFLHENTRDDPRVTVVEGLLATESSAVAATAVRAGGTTHFVSGEAGDARPAVTASQLRALHPTFERLRLAKSDTDGFDVTLIPAIAEAWADAPPVLFFEYDHFLSRAAGNDPLAVWPRLAALGYRRVAVWDNWSLPVGCADVDRIAALTSGLDTARPNEQGRYWDVAVVHGSDAQGLAAIAELVPGEL